MKISDVIWFTNKDGSIGIVLGEDSVTCKKKGYIGSCKGESEGKDVEHIEKWGSKFTEETAERIFKHFKGGSG